MALCAKCGADISEGEEFCDNCKKSDGVNGNSDESYLDDLLNSLKYTEPPLRQDIPQKKKTEGVQQEENYSELDLSSDQNEEGLSTNMRMGMDNMKDKIDNGNNFDEEKDLKHENNSFDYADIDLNEIDINNMGLEDIDISGIDINDLDVEDLDLNAIITNNLDQDVDYPEEIDINSLGLEDASSEEIDINSLGLEDTSSEEIDINSLGLEDVDSNEIDINNTGLQDVAPEEIDINSLGLDDVILGETITYDDSLNSLNTEKSDNNQDTEVTDNMEGNVAEDLYDDFDNTLNLDDIFALDDNYNNEDTISETMEESLAQDTEVESPNQDFDFDSLVGNMLDNLDNNVGLDDNVSLDNNGALDASEVEEVDYSNGITDDDLMNLLNNISDESEAEANNAVVSAGGDNRAEISSDTGANAEVESLDDIFSMEDMFSSLTEEDFPDLESQNLGADIGDVFNDSLSAVSSHQDVHMEEDMMNLIPETVEKKEAKQSIWAKLFGNIKDEKSAKQAVEDQEQSETKKAAKKEKKKNKKGGKDNSATGEDSSDKKNEKKVKKEKSAKKAKKIKEKKVKKIMEEVEEDHGRINKVGAAIVFLFFGIVTVVIIVGTNNFSYSNSIQSAKKYLSINKYEEAYEAIAGTELKEKDAELYERVITVMSVKKQLNSFENYYSSDMYPEALDALLKGLKRYDKNIEKASEIGVQKELKSMRSDILVNLKDSFDLSEDQAYDIIDSVNQEEYSAKVFATVNGN